MRHLHLRFIHLYPERRYHQVISMLTQTEFDAVSVEAHYKGELARMVKRLEKAEQDLSEARNSAKWLSLQVKTLERERDELKKVNANLEKVRTDRRYMHALEVIKDLLNGRAHQQMQPPGVDTAIDANLYREIVAEARQEGGPSTDWQTAPSHRSSGQATALPLPLTPAHSLDAVGQAREPREAVPPDPSLFREASEDTLPESDPEPTTGTSRALSGRGHGMSVTPATITTSVSPKLLLRDSYNAARQQEHYIFWEVPPGCASEVGGPESLENLEHSLLLGDDERRSIEELQQQVTLGLSVVVKALDNRYDVVFMYHPIFYEIDKVSFLVAWAEGNAFDQSLDLLARTCNRTKQGKRPILQVLSCPAHSGTLEQEDWWYLGPMKWEMVQMPPIWDILELEQKQKVVDQLHGNCAGSMRQGEIAEKLQNGRLRQLAIRMEAASTRHKDRFLRLAPGLANSAAVQVDISGESGGP